MKKFFKVFTLLALTCVIAVCAFACNNNKTPAKSGAEYRYLAGEKILIKYNAEEGVTEFAVPDDVDKILSGAFKNNASLKKVIVSDSVKEIGEKAFEGMKSLEKIVLPFTGVKSYEKGLEKSKKLFGTIFGTDEYDEGVKLTQHYTASDSLSFYIPKTLKSVTVRPSEDYDLPDYAFYGADTLTNISLGDNVTAIGDSAFYGCYMISKFTVPSSVGKIGESAFVGCTRLTGTAGSEETDNFIFAEGINLKSIGKEAFKGTKLTVMKLPDTVETIGENCFASDLSGTDITVNGESKLTAVYLPAALTEISPYLFVKCVNLEKVYYGENVKKIWVGAFKYCDKLKLVSYDTEDTVDTYGNIKIAATVENVYADAFAFLGNDGEIGYFVEKTDSTVCDSNYLRGTSILI